jgi:hypothetical protein
MKLGLFPVASMAAAVALAACNAEPGAVSVATDRADYARSFELELAALGGRPLTTVNDGLSDFTCASRVDHNCEEP